MLTASSRVTPDSRLSWPIGVAASQVFQSSSNKRGILTSGHQLTIRDPSFRKPLTASSLWQKSLWPSETWKPTQPWEPKWSKRRRRRKRAFCSKSSESLEKSFFGISSTWKVFKSCSFSPNWNLLVSPMLHTLINVFLWVRWLRTILEQQVLEEYKRLSAGNWTDHHFVMSNHASWWATAWVF